MKNFSKLFIALCVMASITTTSAVYASSAPVVLDLEGNPTCNSLVDNSIFEARDTSVGSGDTLILTTGQELTYTVDGDTVDHWIVGILGLPTDLPVNFVILKGTGNSGARVYHYGTSGVLEDESLVGPGPLKTVSFCYGFNGEPPAPPVADDVDRCDVVETEAGVVNGVEVFCPTDGEYSIHVIKKGEQFEYDECTCNATATVCDKSLPAGELGACVSTCPDTGYPIYTDNTMSTVLYGTKEACLEDNQLREAPGAIVPWNNGSGWCSSVLGSISCKRW